MQTAYKDLLNYYIQPLAKISKPRSTIGQGWAGSWGIQQMTQELHAAQVDQTYNLGKLMDAQLVAEEQSRHGKLLIEAQQRLHSFRTACEIDLTGPGLFKAYQISRAFNHGSGAR